MINFKCMVYVENIFRHSKSIYVGLTGSHHRLLLESSTSVCFLKGFGPNVCNWYSARVAYNMYHHICEEVLSIS